MLKIPGTDRVTNEEVLIRTGHGRKFFITIKIRKTAYLGYIPCNDNNPSLYTMIKGNIERKKGIGRTRKSLLQNTREWTQASEWCNCFMLQEIGKHIGKWSPTFH